MPKKRIVPKTKPKLAMLEPTTLPSDKSGKPSKAARILVISSGKDVANETIVIPTTNFEIFMRTAIATAAFNKKSPPKSRIVKPDIKKIESI